MTKEELLLAIAMCKISDESYGAREKRVTFAIEMRNKLTREESLAINECTPILN